MKMQAQYLHTANTNCPRWQVIILDWHQHTYTFALPFFLSPSRHAAVFVSAVRFRFTGPCDQCVSYFHNTRCTLYIYLVIVVFVTSDPHSHQRPSLFVASLLFFIPFRQFPLPLWPFVLSLLLAHINSCVLFRFAVGFIRRHFIFTSAYDIYCWWILFPIFAIRKLNTLTDTHAGSHVYTHGNLFSQNIPEPLNFALAKREQKTQQKRQTFIHIRLYRLDIMYQLPSLVYFLFASF